MDSRDIWKDPKKWIGKEELSSVGLRQHYLLGFRNRIRYINDGKTFLKTQFDPHEILIYSSNINRTMVSASSQLQGFYPQDAETGETLTDEKIKIAYPQVNVSYDEIINCIFKRLTLGDWIDIFTYKKELAHE